MPRQPPPATAQARARGARIHAERTRTPPPHAPCAPRSRPRPPHLPCTKSGPPRRDYTRADAPFRAHGPPYRPRPLPHIRRAPRAPRPTRARLPAARFPSPPLPGPPSALPHASRGPPDAKRARHARPHSPPSAHPSATTTPGRPPRVPRTQRARRLARSHAGPSSCLEVTEEAAPRAASPRAAGATPRRRVRTGPARARGLDGGRAPPPVTSRQLWQPSAAPRKRATRQGELRERRRRASSPRPLQPHAPPAHGSGPASPP